MIKLYLLDTSDIVLPFVDILGDAYTEGDPHPLDTLNCIGDIAVKTSKGIVEVSPLHMLSNCLRPYAGRRQLADIRSHAVTLWARINLLIGDLQISSEINRFKIVAINAGDLSVSFQYEDDDYDNLIQRGS